MKRNEIIIEINNSKWFWDACINIGKHNHEDLKQEFFVFCCQQPDDKIIQIYPYLRWWVVNVLVRIAHPGNQRKQFHKLYTHKHDEIESDHEQTIETNTHDELFIARDMVLSNLDWFDRKVFEIYESGKPYSKIARDAHIHHNTIKNSIQSTQKLIKLKYESLIGNNINIVFSNTDR